MTTSKKAYLLMVFASAAFIVYVLYTNVILDSPTADFLSHKTNLKRALQVHTWMKVMYVHVAFACLSMIAGAVNFSASILKKHRKFHRLNGYFYLVSVLIVVLTSGYMAPYATGGKATSIPFNLLNIVWPAFTVIAILKIKKKQLDLHRRWMARSYAFVFTNLSIHALTALLHDGIGLAYTQSYTISVYASIVLLLLAAEAVNRVVLDNLKK
ncbi:DUF2306 domain-containing protein [Paenibacillus cremeus]|uniref:DUF2306 domain-containing protein n=1 Tax=Paenibacillus cremeus TaxID=2163881 RepID=A0A559JPT6_9BACL|nr:DUF2306 domain-containing protein [Paenibacillus cremeus]TVY01887.1 DUF2306 domain-containing protein [Paenibacillus cremeus]